MGRQQQGDEAEEDNMLSEADLEEDDLEEHADEADDFESYDEYTGEEQLELEESEETEAELVDTKKNGKKTPYTGSAAFDVGQVVAELAHDNITKKKVRPPAEDEEESDLPSKGTRK
eukprot:TRINITY_DN2552_c0_g1_i2.p2 TRINITY_DN2552_c0_g1~~TRINITY_DN2552_c0_g1_i2.p2  ORF type:complete len:127 (-),score=54.18 TRINITY_DN2552_c0_g1_i2:41-391(-)